MPDYRVSYIMSQAASRPTGWSENFWCSSASLNAAIASANIVLPRLMSIHGEQTICTDLRVVELGVNRIGRLISVNANGGEAASASDYPTTCLYIQMTGAGGRKTGQWIKGIWDDIVVTGGVFINEKNYRQFFGKFASTVAENFGMRVLAPQAQKDVLGLNPATGAMTVNAHGYATGDNVRISGVLPGPSNYANRIWKIIVTDANTFTVLGWNPPLDYAFQLGAAKARLQAYQIIGIDNVSFMRISKRNVGRPFGAPRGRRQR